MNKTINILECQRVRQSNMELLRIIAILMVVAIHVNFLSIGEPTTMQTHIMPANTLARWFFYSLCIGCVDIFILLSGWFGITPRVKSICSLLFQVLFTTLGVLMFYVCFLGKQPTISDYAVYLIPGSGLWFVPSYLCLYLLSPILNCFVSNSTRKQFLIFLILFGVFQFAYGWLRNTASFAYGCSPLSFVFLYMLARYIKLYANNRLSKKPNVFLIMFLGCVCLLTITAWTLLYLGFSKSFILHDFNSPIVIFMSVMLLLYFSRINFTNNIVNRIGTACFTVYIIHQCPGCTFETFTSTAAMIYNNYSALNYFGVIITFILTVFIIAITVNQLRLYAWCFLCRHTPQKLSIIVYHIKWLTRKQNMSEFNDSEKTNR